MSTPGTSLRFPRGARITRGAELQRIAREGKRIRTEHIEVRIAASPLALAGKTPPTMRIGMVVPKFKQTAVARNRLKRRLRELARLRMLPTGVVIDVVLRVRPHAYLATFDMLGTDIARAMAEIQRRVPLPVVPEQSDTQ